MSRQINLRVSPELLKAIDSARGDVPRNRYIVRLLEAATAGSGVLDDALALHEAAERERGALMDRNAAASRGGGYASKGQPSVEPALKGPRRKVWVCPEDGCGFVGKGSVSICPDHEVMVVAS